MANYLTPLSVLESHRCKTGNPLAVWNYKVTDYIKTGNNMPLNVDAYYGKGIEAHTQSRGERAALQAKRLLSSATCWSNPILEPHKYVTGGLQIRQAPTQVVDDLDKFSHALAHVQKTLPAGHAMRDEFNTLTRPNTYAVSSLVKALKSINTDDADKWLARIQSPGGLMAYAKTLQPHKAR